MDMEEKSISALLHGAADNYDPHASFIDVEAARKVGRRRQWAGRASMTAGVAAVAAVAVAGVLVLPAHFRTAGTGGTAGQPAAAARPSAKTTVAEDPVPKSFASMAMPATFGWLPAGFSGTRPMLNSFVAADQAQIQVASSDNRMLDFNVSPWTGSAQPTPDPAAADPMKILGTAPTVNGEPAYWTNYGLAWEYAAGAWAYLSPSNYLGSDNVPKGWLDQADASAQTCSRPNTSVPLKCTTPPGGPMSAQTKAILEKVASNVRWTWKPQGWYPFQFTHPLPAGWRITSASEGDEGGQLRGAQIQVAAANGDMGMVLDFGPQRVPKGNCAASSTTTVTLDGIQWSSTAGSTYSLTTCAPVDGLTGGISVYPEGMSGNGAAKQSLPGVSELGANPAETILSWLKFLGPNPANWTSQPLAG
jgi:hypothetical protein